MEQLPKSYQQFRTDYPDLYAAYTHLGETAAASGPLDPKTRELVRLGMAAAIRSQSAVESHTHRALEAGATPSEVEHALLIGINTLGFSTMMAAFTWARGAIADHQG